MPQVARIVARHDADTLARMAQEAKLPFARIARPEELFDDPHLLAGGRLLDTELPGGVETRLPALPVELDGRRTRLTRDPPAAGADTRSVMEELGLPAAEIDALIAGGVLVDGGGAA